MVPGPGAERWSLSCPDPSRKGRNDVSSRPQTPCDPAGSRVYVSTNRRIKLKYLQSESSGRNHLGKRTRAVAIASVDGSRVLSRNNVHRNAAKESS
jgi:hypothetical protein